MNKHTVFYFLIVSVVFLILFLPPAPVAYGWGFHGHKKINNMAVFTLPPSMIGFFKSNIDFVTEHSVDPDKRRYAVSGEAERHFLDVDRYGANPFDSIPKFWKNAVGKYGEDSLHAHGILPWWIEKMLYRLTEAFKKQDKDRILHCAADIGHYIADAHVPLHTTRNYNGQLTNQKGIHAFWESRIPELYSENYDFLVGRAKYIDKPMDVIWQMIKSSYAAVDSVLKFEADLNLKFPPDKKYSFEVRGNQTVKVYSAEYTDAYNKLLNGMVERRMIAAVKMVGSFWYTAWVNAGQPQLDNIGSKDFNDSLKKSQEELEKIWKTGGPPKNDHGHED